MNKSKMIKSSFKTMERHKMRTFFMMLGIIVGIAALTLIFSFGKMTEEKVMNNIEKLFSASNILISAGPGQMMGGPGSSGPTTTLTIDDLKVLQDEIPNIDTWDPVVMIPDREIKYREQSINTRIFGHSPEAEEVWNRSVSSGEFFDNVDMNQTSRVALIGEVVAKELFGEMDPIGEQFRIGNVPFQIKGILELQGIDPHGLDRDNEIHVPITTAMRRLLNIDYIMMAKLQLNDPDQMNENVSQIIQLLRERHHLTEGEPDDFSIMTPIQVQEMVTSANKIFNLFLPLIAGISLIVGCVVIANLMLISVNERTNEIGLRKATGARSKDIMLQFLMESTAVTVVGGIVGILLGTLGVYGLTIMMQAPFVIPWQALIIGLVFSTIIGLIAGVFPARRAAALDPVETLK